jgi:hypothetical protein
MLFRKKKNGQSTLEYAVFIIIVLTVMFVMQKYIVRAFSGRWKGVGDSWGHGRVYSPTETVECLYGAPYAAVWYDSACFKAQGGDCISSQASSATCGQIMVLCQSNLCNGGG